MRESKKKYFEDTNKRFSLYSFINISLLVIIFLEINPSVNNIKSIVAVIILSCIPIHSSIKFLIIGVGILRVDEDTESLYDLKGSLSIVVLAIYGVFKMLKVIF